MWPALPTPALRQGTPQTHTRNCGNQSTHQSLITDVYRPCLLPYALILHDPRNDSGRKNSPRLLKTDIRERAVLNKSSGDPYLEGASQSGGNAGLLWAPERGIAATNELIEVAVENAGSGLKQQMDAARCPAHRLTFVAALVDDLVDRRLHEAGGDAFAGAEALAIVHDVAHVVGDVRREVTEGGG
jgi:hypothetical protein